jgi:hypothetical protein
MTWTRHAWKGMPHARRAWRALSEHYNDAGDALRAWALAHNLSEAYADLLVIIVREDAPGVWGWAGASHAAADIAKLGSP